LPASILGQSVAPFNCNPFGQRQLCFIASLYNPHTEVSIQLSKGQLTSGKMLRILGRFAAGGLGGGTGCSAQDKKTSGDQRKIAPVEDFRMRPERVDF